MYGRSSDCKGRVAGQKIVCADVFGFFAEKLSRHDELALSTPEQHVRTSARDAPPILSSPSLLPPARRPMFATTKENDHMASFCVSPPRYSFVSDKTAKKKCAARSKFLEGFPPYQVTATRAAITHSDSKRSITMRFRGLSVLALVLLTSLLPFPSTLLAQSTSTPIAASAPTVVPALVPTLRDGARVLRSSGRSRRHLPHL